MFLSGILARGRIRVKVNRPVRIGRAGRALPALAWMAGIFWLSQQSQPLGVHGNEQASIIAHLTLYSGLALLLFLALTPDSHRRYAREATWLVPSIAFAVAVLYGALDEVHQAFVAGRTASDADLDLDAVGAAVGVCLALLTSLGRAKRR